MTIFTGLRAPQPVYCATEHLHRDIALARAVCEGRFTHAGVTIAIDGEPDWTYMDIHADREWWIEWTKFYYALDLAHAYCATDDRRFLDTWQRLLGGWAADVPADFGPTDAIGRRLQNWIYSWNALASSLAFPGLPRVVEDTIVGSMMRQAQYLRAHLTPERNHRTLELYALLVVGLSFSTQELFEELATFAWTELQRNLLTDVRTDGVQREHSTHYHMVALRSFVAARENARRFGLPLPPAYDERLSAAVDFAMFCQRPDGTIPAVSDSDSGDYRECLALAASLLGRSDVAYVASNAAHGTPPPRDCADFPVSGYYIQRSAWYDLIDRPQQHRHLIFDCGAIGDGGHGHYDLLSIDVWAGRPLIVDPGRYTYAEMEPNWRHWFKGTPAHNTVTIDGLDQTTYFCGKPKGNIASGQLITRINAPRMQVLGGTVKTPRYDARHTRHVFFLAQDYWVVIDRLEAASLHTYDLRYHLATDAWHHVEVHNSRVTAPGLGMAIVGPGTIAIEDGWVSPQYGVKHSAPVLSMQSAPQRDALFVTLIVPQPDGPAPFEMRVDAAADETLSITISGVGAGHASTDRLVWRPGGAPFALPEMDGVADIAWTRGRSGGEATEFCAARLRDAVDGHPVAPWLLARGGEVMWGSY
ncbi:MAG: alginate lyase family protein [Acidobacteria bacterium]|nr:alginate lyase family protein [Acidobacteriota bacterium]